MSSPAEETLAIVAAPEAEEEQKLSDDNDIDNDNSGSEQEWETMARAWLSSFPEAKAVSMAEVEAWIDSNFHIIPEGIKSMPRADVCQRLISIQNCMRLPPDQEKEEKEEKEEEQGDIPHARFQRTDQWRPVYIWLESLDRDDVVKSRDITEWLTANPSIQENLGSRHSRYHLMHYIKKCHMKILKRRERNKGAEQSDTPESLKVHKDVEMKQPAPLPCTKLINIPQDSELYEMKRKEALEKFQILVELEKLLSPMFIKREGGNK